MTNQDGRMTERTYGPHGYTLDAIVSHAGDPDGDFSANEYRLLILALAKHLRELLSAPAAPTDAQVVQHILDEGERHEDRRLHAAIHGPVSEPPTAPAAPREREKGNLEAIEARVRPTICATFTVLDDGPRTRMEGRISREDFEALLDLAGRGRTVTTDETVAKAISALRTPDASLARVPNTIRQSIADIIEGLASRALAPSTSGGK